MAWMTTDIKYLIILIFLSISVAGCDNQQSSDELHSEIIERCSPLAINWFNENMGDAENISVDLYYISRSEVCYDVITGNYSKREKTYNYYLNVDTGEFCSEEYYDILYEYLRLYLAENLNVKYKDMYFSLQESTIHGKVVSDQDMNKKRDELKVYEVAPRCYKSYELFHENELTTIAMKKVKDLEITIIVDDVENFINDFSSVDMLEKHENCVLIVNDEKGAEIDCRISYVDGKYQVARALIDERGRTWYNVYYLEN